MGERIRRHRRRWRQQDLSRAQTAREHAQGAGPAPVPARRRGRAPRARRTSRSRSSRASSSGSSGATARARARCSSARRDLRRRRGGIVIAGRLTPFIELGVGFNPELTALDNVIINGVMIGPEPGAGARALRRRDRVRRARGVRRPQAQELLLGNAGAAGLLADGPERRRGAADRRGARGRRRGLPAEVLQRVLPPARRGPDDHPRDPRHDARSSASATARCCSSTGEIVDSGDPRDGGAPLHGAELRAPAGRAAGEDGAQRGAAVVRSVGRGRRPRGESVAARAPFAIHALVEALHEPIERPELHVRLDQRATARRCSARPRATSIGAGERLEPGERVHAARAPRQPAGRRPLLRRRRRARRPAAGCWPTADRARDFMVYGGPEDAGLVTIPHTVELDRAQPRAEAEAA